jgi:hypothetical protein
VDTADAKHHCNGHGDCAGQFFGLGNDEMRDSIGNGPVVRLVRRASKWRTAAIFSPKCPLFWVLIISILIVVFAVTLRAQTSGEAESSSFSSSIASLLDCTKPESECVLNSDATDQDGSSQKDADNSSTRNHDDWLHAWARKVDETRASQPHFVSPIVTTHVMLVQQYRYDMSWQQDPAGATTTANYGASRGLEIIPATRFEIGIFPPGYLTHQSNSPDGFGDLAWQIKFRAFSATEGKGDYFVGFFLGGSSPTGTPPNGAGHTILSPTFAAAKGIGHWDIQSTIGANLPASGANLLGDAIVFNTAVDYKIRGKLWPMLEQNSIFWSGGTLDGKKQVFLTPGVELGSFPLAERLHLTLGGGVQIAATRFHQYNHRWIVSVRFPF